MRWRIMVKTVDQVNHAGMRISHKLIKSAISLMEAPQTVN